MSGFLIPLLLNPDLSILLFALCIFPLSLFFVLFGGCHLGANWNRRKSLETEHPASTLCRIDKNISSFAREQEAEAVTWPAVLFASGSIQGILARLFRLWSVMADKMLLEKSERRSPTAPFCWLVFCDWLWLFVFDGQLEDHSLPAFFIRVFNDKS